LGGSWEKERDETEKEERGGIEGFRTVLKVVQGESGTQYLI